MDFNISEKQWALVSEHKIFMTFAFEPCIRFGIFISMNVQIYGFAESGDVIETCAFDSVLDFFFLGTMSLIHLQLCLSGIRFGICIFMEVKLIIVDHLQ